MYEAPEHTPIIQKKLPTNEIFKDSWHLSIKYFTALVLPHLIISIPILIVAFLGVFLGVEKTYKEIANFVIGLAWVIISMGIHRVILRLKTEGIEPRFEQVFSEGYDYWWRGIKVNFMAGLYSIPVFILCTILIIPSVAVGGILAIIAVITSLSFLVWFVCRACLAAAAMADQQSSAVESFAYGWDLTKGRTLQILKILLAILGAILLLVVLPFTLINIFFRDPLILIPIYLGLWIVYMFCIAFAQTIFNLIYQNLKSLNQNTPKDN
jgi:hypothetical protein